MIWRSRVLLPQPELPIMIMVSPFSTVKLIPLRTVRFPNLRTRSRTSMTGSSILIQNERRRCKRSLVLSHAPGIINSRLHERTPSHRSKFRLAEHERIPARESAAVHHNSPHRVQIMRSTKSTGTEALFDFSCQSGTPDKGGVPPHANSLPRRAPYRNVCPSITDIIKTSFSKRLHKPARLPFCL